MAAVHQQIVAMRTSRVPLTCLPIARCPRCCR